MISPWKGRLVIVLVSRARARERNGIPENPGFPTVSSIRNPHLKGIGNVSVEHVHEHDYEHVHVSGRADCL